MTPYAEIIGDPVMQSKSPAIHRFWLTKLGLAGDYHAHQLEVIGLPDYLAARRGDEYWRGCNVTMPHKQQIVPHLDHIEGSAGPIGAVNTVRPEKNRKLVGLNTDAEGFLEPLRPLLERTHWFRMARVLGTGGAARAIVVALASEGFTIVLAGRDAAKANALLDELALQGEHHAVDLSHFAAPTDFVFDDRRDCLDLVVNATPLGMAGQPALAFDWSHAPPGAIAYDIVTDPVLTPFLKAAQKAGHRTIDGLGMLIGQAAAAFEVFFGTKPPREYDAELRELLAR